MDKKLEALANKIMKEYERDGEPITFEEAVEVAQMELNAKNLKNYTQSEETVKKKAEGKKTREKKVDTEKADILKIITDALNDKGYNARITNVDKYVEIGDTILINLIKHRPKKD